MKLVSKFYLVLTILIVLFLFVAKSIKRYFWPKIFRTIFKAQNLFSNDTNKYSYNVYTKKESFSVVHNNIEEKYSRNERLLGIYQDNFYAPAFFRSKYGYKIKTEFIHLNNVFLHVEDINGQEKSCLLKGDKILDYPYQHIYQDSDIYTASQNGRIIQLDCAIDLLFFTTSYYHWLIDGLPRIINVLEAGFDLNHKKLLLPRLERFQKECLELAGIDVEQQVVQLGKREWAKVKQCIVPTAYFPVGEPKINNVFAEINTSIANKIKKHTLGNLKYGNSIAKNRKLYISRAKAKRRNIINEDEVFNLLRARGFEKILLEDLPWRDQIILFSEAEFVVGMHGAGLANMVFSDHCKLIEFMNPEEVRAYFSILCYELDHKYSFLMCKRSNRTDNNFNDLYVDINELYKIVMNMEEVS